MALVVDASGLLMAVLAGTPESGRLRRRLVSEVCHAPHLIDAEIGHALRRQVQRGELPEPTGSGLLEWSGTLVDHRHEMSGVLAVGAWARGLAHLPRDVLRLQGLDGADCD